MKNVFKAHMLLVITTAVFFVTGVIVSLLPAEVRINLPVWFVMSIGSLAILLPPLIYCLVKRISPAAAVGLRKTRPINFLMAVLVLICAYPVVTVLNFISMLFVENAVQDTMMSLLFTTNLPVMLLVMAVLPAVSEEFLFRGILYNTYRKTSPILGVFLSALFFALLHGNFNQIPYALFLGIVLALMMEATGSIAIPMFMHFLMNGSSVLISYMMKPVFFKEQVMNGLNGFSESENMLEMLNAMVGPKGLTMVIAIYAFIAVLFAAAVAALIYAVFLINKKSIKQLIVPGRKLGQRLGMLDWWVAAYLGLIIVHMILML